MKKVLILLLLLFGCTHNTYSPFDLLTEKVTFEQVRDLDKHDSDDRVTATIVDSFSTFNRSPESMTFDGTHLWIICSNRIIERRTTDGAYDQSILSTNYDLRGMAYHNNSLWIVYQEIGTNFIAEIPLPVPPALATIKHYIGSLDTLSAVYYDSELWMIGKNDKTMYIVDSLSSIRTINLDANYQGIEEMGGAFYMLEEYSGSSFLVKKLPGSSINLWRVELSVDDLTGLTYDGTYFWASSKFQDRIYKIKVEE